MELHRRDHPQALVHLPLVTVFQLLHLKHMVPHRDHRNPMAPRPVVVDSEVDSEVEVVDLEVVMVDLVEAVVVSAVVDTHRACQQPFNKATIRTVDTSTKHTLVHDFISSSP